MNTPDKAILREYRRDCRAYHGKLYFTRLQPFARIICDTMRKEGRLDPVEVAHQLWRMMVAKRQRENKQLPNHLKFIIYSAALELDAGWLP